MSKMRYKAGLAAVLLAMTGCAMPSLFPTGQAPAVVQGKASLSLKVNWGRQTQTVASDVTHLKVMVTLPSGEVQAKDFEPTSGQDLDFPGLPGEEVRVKVEASNESGILGTGNTIVALFVGRRTFAQVTIGLTGEGANDFGPLAPIDVPNDPNLANWDNNPYPQPSPTDGYHPSPSPSYSPPPLDELGTSSLNVGVNVTVGTDAPAFQDVATDSIDLKQSFRVPAAVGASWTYQVSEPQEGEGGYHQTVTFTRTEDPDTIHVDQGYSQDYTSSYETRLMDTNACAFLYDRIDAYRAIQFLGQEPVQGPNGSVTAQHFFYNVPLNNTSEGGVYARDIWVVDGMGVVKAVEHSMTFYGSSVLNKDREYNLTGVHNQSNG